MLLLDVLVKEISYRNEHNMLSIELKTIDLAQCVGLLEDIKALIPEEMKGKGKEFEKKSSLEPPSHVGIDRQRVASEKFNGECDCYCYTDYSDNSGCCRCIGFV